MMYIIFIKNNILLNPGSEIHIGCANEIWAIVRDLGEFMVTEFENNLYDQR